MERRKAHTKICAYKRSQQERFIVKAARNSRLNEGRVLKYMTIHCSAYEKSPEVTCAQSWNAQKAHIRLTDTLIAYKNLVKQAMLDTISENKD